MGNQNFQDVEKYRSLPEIALQIISFLDFYITKEMKVFEWGVGGSTVFFNSRAGQTISVEHSREYFDVVSEAVRYRCNGDGTGFIMFIPPDEIISLDADQFKSSHPTGKGKTFRNYVMAIDKYEDEYFDVIFIDGRARAACIKRAAPKLKSGGVMVVDNTERPEYQQALALDGWERCDGIGPAPYLSLVQMVQTSALIKP